MPQLCPFWMALGSCDYNQEQRIQKFRGIDASPQEIISCIYVLPLVSFKHFTNRCSAYQGGYHCDLQFTMSYCCKISPSENTQTPLTPKGKSLLPANSCSGNLPKSCSPDPHSSLSLIRKTHILGFHSVDKKQNYMSQKSRLVHLGTFLDLGTMDQGP